MLENISHFDNLFSKKILFFGGKGGVGKSTCASAYATLASEKGKKVLIVSTDPAHSSSDIFQKDLSGGEITSIHSNLYGLEIDSEVETAKYIKGVKESISEVVQSPLLLQEINKQINLAKSSPGAEESALFLKIVQLIQNLESNYEQIIFDTAPTGHTLRLLTLPDLMNAWINGLIKQRHKVNKLQKMWNNLTDKVNSDDKILSILENRRSQFATARSLLMKVDYSSFIFVLIPERLPILETQKAVDLLVSHKIPIGGLIINKTLPDNLKDDFFISRKLQENKYIKEIESIFQSIPLFHFPLKAKDIQGHEALLSFAQNFFPR